MVHLSSRPGSRSPARCTTDVAVVRFRRSSEGPDAVPPRHPAGHRRGPCDARLQALAAGAASRRFFTPLAGRRALPRSRHRRRRRRHHDGGRAPHGHVTRRVAGVDRRRGHAPAHRAPSRRRRSAHRAPRTPAGARRARGYRREAGQDRRRVPDALDDTLPAADRRPARHRLARARAAGRRRRAAVQASRPTAERARPHREPRGRLPPVAARPCGTSSALQSELVDGSSSCCRNRQRHRDHRRSWPGIDNADGADSDHGRS